MVLGQSMLLGLLARLKLTAVTDHIRYTTETLYQDLTDAERTTQRNGTTPRTLTTTAGDLGLRIPKLRQAPSPAPCWNAAAASTKRCSRS